jgi:LacI family transcriptional regulator
MPSEGIGFSVTDYKNVSFLQTGVFMPKITIGRVAEEAGVSKGTVSRVLNARAGVNDETRSLVQGVMDRLGYVPDPGARQLARRGRHVIGLMLDDDLRRGGTYYGILRDALEERFAAQGYHTQVIASERADDLESIALDGVPDGIILLGVHLDDPRPAALEARRVPFVMIGRSIQNTAWVDVDNLGGLRDAIRHLVALGHTRIVHITGAHTGQASVQRLEGYLAGLREAKLPEDASLIWDGDFTALGGYRAVRRALEQKHSFTAIAAASDEMAYGAIEALQDAGLRVPWDISVTGFDDLPLAGRNGLTTARQPILEIGHCAAELLLERMDGKPTRSQLVPTTLLVRTSSAALLKNTLLNNTVNTAPP